MISHYLYCGYSTTKYGNKLIWGAASYVENGYSTTYMFWGSPKNPIVRRYHSYAFRSRNETLHYKIIRKRMKMSGYIEVQDNDIKTHFPELEGQIGMYILAKKLKSNDRN